jgi:hypothetical protein
VTAFGSDAVVHQTVAIEQRKIEWRTTADEDGQYCFAVALRASIRICE